MKIHKNYLIIIFLIYFFSAFLIYFPILHTFFISDDFSQIYAVHTKGAFGISTVKPAIFFRPIFSLILSFDHYLWGFNPIGYHITNVFIHIINAFLVFHVSYLLINRFYPKRKSYLLSFFSGYLFLLAFFHSEVVTWISGRTSSIVTLFYLSGLYTYILFREKNVKKYPYGCICFFSLALLSNELAITFPLIIMLYEVFIKDSRGFKKITKQISPFIFISLLYILLRTMFLRKLIGGYGVGTHFNLSPNLLIDNLVCRLAMMISPPLSEPLMRIIGIILIFFIVTFTSLLFLKKSAKIKLILFILLSFFVNFIITLNVGRYYGNSLDQRFLYIPSLFLFLFFIICINCLIKNNTLLLFFFIVLCAYSGFFLYSYNSSWIDAGKISQTYATTLNNSFIKGDIILVNLPDNIHGAYLFRNGFREALYLFSYVNESTPIIVQSRENLKNNKVTTELIYAKNNTLIQFNEIT